MKYIVSYSGGKDSTATLLWAYERYAPENIIVAFCDTGWETRTTYDYVEYISEWCESKDISFNKIKPAMQFEELVYHKKMFPRSFRRYCTQMLKIKPFFMFISQIQQKEVLVGERSQESPSREKKAHTEFNEYYNCYLHRPIKDWTHDDVFKIHQKHNIKHNPMYDLGFSRVGCAPCIMANKKDIALINKYFPEQIDKIKKLENNLQQKREEAGLADYNNTFFKPKVVGGETIADIDEQVYWANSTYGTTLQDFIPDSCKASYAILCE